RYFVLCRRYCLCRLPVLANLCASPSASAREVHPLAEAANSALDRLAAAYAAERRFVSDAAHELRTPLTVLDLRLQDARQTGQPDWPALNMEMRQMRRLVAQLLELARQDGAAVERRDGPLQRANASRVAREATAAL